MERIPLPGLVVALALTGAGIAAPGAGQAGPGPEALAVDPVHEAGDVRPGTEITHTFTVRNAGDAPLEIRQVKPTCGCTVAEFDRRIAPGSSGEVSVVVDTSSFRGPIAKSVTVLTNDTENPSLRLTVRAEVVAPVEVVPGYFRFLHVRGTGAERQVQTLYASDGRGVEILGVDSPHAFLELEHRAATAEERSAAGPESQSVLVATLASNAPTGPLAGTVVVRTDHPDLHRLEIPVTGYVKPLVGVSPPSAEFGTFPPDDPRKGSVIVTNHGEEPIRVTGAESDVEGLTAEVVERDAGRQYAIRMTLDPRLMEGSKLDGTVTVTTDSDSHPRLEFPVTGTLVAEKSR